MGKRIAWLSALALVMGVVLGGCELFRETESTVKIGVVGPMQYVQGEHHWMGAQMAADEINAEGGVQVGEETRKIELVQVDSNEIVNVTEATNAVERAITSDEVDFLTGGFRSEAVLAMQEVAMDHQVIFLGAGAAHPKLCERVGEDYDRYKYWFRVTPVNSTFQGKTLFAVLNTVAGHVRDRLGIETPRVAILAEKAVWTEGIVSAAQRTLPQMGMEVVGTWQPSPTASDLTAELSAIKRNRADIVFTVISGPVGIVLGRQMAELQIPAVPFGINVEAQNSQFYEATAGKGDYVTTLDFVAEVQISPETVDWVHRFKERFGQRPIYNAGTYTAIRILAKTIEEVGSLDPDALVTALEDTDHQGVGGRITFTENHDLRWGPDYVTGLGVQWQDGEVVAFWPNGWQGVSYDGMQPYKLPPWMLEQKQQ